MSSQGWWIRSVLPHKQMWFWVDLWEQNTNSVLCAVSKWTSGLHLFSHMSTKIPHRRPEQAVFPSMENERMTHLPNYQHGNKCLSFPKIPTLALNHLSNAEMFTDMLLICFSFLQSVFVPPLFLYIWAVHSLIMTWNKLSQSLSLHSRPPVWWNNKMAACGGAGGSLMKRVH